MRRLISMVLVSTGLALGGCCHTCDVCDDCGTCGDYGVYSQPGCTSCGGYVAGSGQTAPMRVATPRNSTATR